MDQNKIEAVDNPLWKRLGLHELRTSNSIVLGMDELHRMAVDGSRVQCAQTFLSVSAWFLKRYLALTSEERRAGHRYVDGAAGGSPL